MLSHPGLQAPKGLASKYTAAPPDALELLSGMLHFNPKKR